MGMSVRRRESRSGDDPGLAMSALAYATSPTKRRRTRDEIAAIKFAIVRELQADQPMTVRQLFYRLTVLGVVPKTQNEYKSTVQRLTLLLRRQGFVPYGWISDHTRWMHKDASYASAEAGLRAFARAYRRSLWDNQHAHVEVWCEKDALAGVLMEETNPWDVPLMVARGFSSETYLYEAAETIKAIGKPAYIYQFGDHDPSGVAAAHQIERSLRRFAPDIEIHFERVAVTPEQIALWNLPTRPTKTTDSRARTFVGASVELDAIPSAQLRELVRDRIARHVDEAELRVVEVAEESERRLLAFLASPALIAAAREEHGW
jgi:hypothetical protein